MPCLPGEAKHHLCRPVRCDTDDPCPCTPRSAFSAKLGCDDRKCCCPKTKLNEAFGTFIPIEVMGTTGTPGFPESVSSAGVAGFTSGATGEWTIFFEKNLFDGCPDNLDPSIIISPCNLNPGMTGGQATIICGPRSKTEFTVLLSDDGVPTDSSSGFDFRVVQAPLRRGCH